MAYERITYGGIISGSTIVTGSLSITAGITGSLFGSSSWANTALTLISSSKISISEVTASGLYGSGSNTFGISGSNVHRFTGSINVTGSMVLTGSISATSFSGSLFGSASWAETSVTSSYVSQSVVLRSIQGTNIASSSAQLTNGGPIAFNVSSKVTFGEVTASAMLFSSSISNIRLTVASGGNVTFFGDNTGEIFTMSDTTSSILMNVYNTPSTPILQVFPDDTVVMGRTGSNALVVTGAYVGIGRNNPSYNLDVSGSANVSNTLNAYIVSASFLYVLSSSTQYVSSSVTYLTGSNKFGSSATDVNEFTGSVFVSGSISSIGGITASAGFFGTASYAITASYVLGGSGTALITGSTYSITSSWSNTARTASFVSLANSASYAVTTQNSGKQFTGYVPFISAPNQSTLITNIPSTLTEFGTEMRMKTDLTYVNSCSLSARIENGTTAQIGQLRVQYSIDEITWNYLTANVNNYPSIDLGLTGTKNSAKEAIVPDAKNIVFLRLVTINGDGTSASNATFGNITLNTIYDLK
jgi:hypothetical protein